MPSENAPVAQLDRAPDYESGGQEFESLRARHLRIKPRTFPFSVCLPAMAAWRISRLPTIRMALSSTATASMIERMSPFRVVMSAVSGFSFISRATREQLQQEDSTLRGGDVSLPGLAGAGSFDVSSDLGKVDDQ